jgi:pimeloyl-ACP methyl ester carboxylesterase
MDPVQTPYPTITLANTGLPDITQILRNGNSELSVPSQFIQGKCGRIHYRSYLPTMHTPAKATIVAFHGAAHNGAFYHDMGVQAAQVGFAFHAFDLPGHGRSYWNSDGDRYSYDGLSDEVIYVTKEVTQQPTTNLGYIGSSLGGQLLMIAADKGTQFGAVVLNDIGPKISGYVHSFVVAGFDSIEYKPVNDMAKEAAKRYAYYGLQQTIGTVEFIAESLVMCESASHARYKLDPKFSALYRDLVDNTSYGDSSDSYISPEGQVFIGSDLSRGFDAITAPMMMLRGAESKFFTPEQRDAILMRAVPPKLIEVANVKHPVGLSDVALNTTILNFFEQRLG